ncbi:MAG: hypothetical protein KGL13_08835 [Gammaproteobacteria bacterium]|nr:hypothetical protein [Gammaproteobacteria bacterium]
MLIKTWEPYRHMQQVYEKRARLRRLARRQIQGDGVIRTTAAALPAAPAVMQAMTMPERVLHHAKPHAAPRKTGRIGYPERSAGTHPAITRWNIFGDLHS